jgi:hypothetical protein
LEFIGFQPAHFSLFRSTPGIGNTYRKESQVKEKQIGKIPKWNCWRNWKNKIGEWHGNYPPIKYYKIHKNVNIFFLNIFCISPMFVTHKRRQPKKLRLAHSFLRTFANSIFACQKSYKKPSKKIDDIKFLSGRNSLQDQIWTLTLN